MDNGYTYHSISESPSVLLRDHSYNKQDLALSSTEGTYGFHPEVRSLPATSVCEIGVRYATSAASRTTEEKFNQLAWEWRNETGTLSRLDMRFMHPAYQQIIGMGPPVIPYVLRDLADSRDHWFWALAAISGESPITSEMNGDMNRVAEAWLEWGRRRGYDV